MYFQSSLHSRYIVVYLLSISYLFSGSNKLLTILTVSWFLIYLELSMQHLRSINPELSNISVYRQWQWGRIQVPTEIAFSSHDLLTNLPSPTYIPTYIPSHPPTYLPTTCDTMLRYDKHSFVHSQNLEALKNWASWNLGKSVSPFRLLFHTLNNINSEHTFPPCSPDDWSRFNLESKRKLYKCSIQGQPRKLFLKVFFNSEVRSGMILNLFNFLLYLS